MSSAIEFKLAREVNVENADGRSVRSKMNAFLSMDRDYEARVPILKRSYSTWRRKKIVPNIEA